MTSGVYLYIVYVCRTEGCPGNQEAGLPILRADLVYCGDNDAPYGPHPLGTEHGTRAGSHLGGKGVWPGL